MKVLFTLDTLANSGTEKSTLDIISHFSKDTMVKVVCFYPGDDLKAAYAAAGIEVVDMGFPANMPWYKAITLFKKLLRHEKPDLVVSSILRANLISRIACRQTGIPLVGTFVSDSYSKIRMESFSRKRRIGFYLYYLLDRFTAGIPKRYISNSECIKKSNAAQLRIHPNKVDVVYRGRASQDYTPKQNSLTPGVFRFVYVARLLQTKGLGELVEAMAMVAQKHPQAKLEIYGEGNYRKHITQRINDLHLNDKVTLHGKVPEGWKKLYTADCFVFPSWNEGFSGSLVEAMMVGIPIIASDIPMNLEAVSPDETALVYKVKDQAALAEQMNKSIEHYERMCQMADRARAIAFRRFDIQVIASQYEDILKRVVQ